MIRKIINTIHYFHDNKHLTLQVFLLKSFLTSFPAHLISLEHCNCPRMFPILYFLLLSIGHQAQSVVLFRAVGV